MKTYYLHKNLSGSKTYLCKCARGCVRACASGLKKCLCVFLSKSKFNLNFEDYEELISN